MRYSNIVNGYSSFAISKLDILDEFEEIKVVVGYRLNGKLLDCIPGSLEDLAKVELVYETLKGWKKDTSNIKEPENLPKEAVDYIRFI